MKKTISVLLSLLVCLSVSVSVFADEKSSSFSYTEYYDDGSYCIIEVVTLSPKTRASSTNGYKTANSYSNSGEKLCSVTVLGTFSYNGSSASAISSSCTSTVYSSSVSIISRNSYCSGSSAVANLYYKCAGSNNSKTVVLTCKPNGDLS